MKLSISNIAWNIDEEEHIAELLSREKIKGIEVAPTKISPDILKITQSQLKSYQEFWDQYNIKIIAMQSLLFGRNDLKLFGDASKRDELESFLRHTIDIGATLGCKALIFGSPKNRIRAALSSTEAHQIAIPFFRRLGTYAEKHGVILAIEHNPPEYGTDYLRTINETAEFVRDVNNGGFRLHGDSGGLILSNEPADMLYANAPDLAHYHISEPHLSSINLTHITQHQAFADALKRGHYNKWISIEMRRPEDVDTGKAVINSIENAKLMYRSFLE